jgi:hypothetical protein
MSKYARDKRRVERNLNNRLLWSVKFVKAMDRLDKADKSDSHMQHHWRSERKRKTLMKDRKPAPFHNGKKRA